MPAFPTVGINLFYMSIYGGFGYDGCGGWGVGGFYGCQCAAFLGLASGLPQTGNPPYTVNNFLAIFPKFLGPATLVPSVLTSGDNVITVDSTAVGIAAGQLVVGSGIPAATVVSQVAGLSVTLSANVTGNGSQQLSFYEAPLVPLAAIQIWLNIAFASLMQSNWREQWEWVMALYIGHYCTLYCQTDGNPQGTAAQIVGNSLQAGLTISQGADGVNQGLQLLKALDNWGTWSQTEYGAQLATLGRGVGSGPIYVRR